jgi:hypothetical protein
MNKKIESLKNKVEKIIRTTEYRSTKINGVMCSRSDQEIIVDYCNKLLRDGNLYGLMNPNSDLTEVFKKSGIEFTQFGDLVNKY